MSDRNVGMLVSAPQAWARHLEKTLVREAKTITPSEWVGSEGDKIKVDLTIENVSFFEKHYGVTVLYTMRDAAGNIFKWFASREALGDVVVGKTVTLVATIKKHNVFQGVKETVVTRAKAV